MRLQAPARCAGELYAAEHVLLFVRGDHRILVRSGSKNMFL